MPGPLIITGMHRSGTSLVANYLQRCGLDLGNELLPADPGNRFGYYEDEAINAFHRELLSRSGIADGFSVSKDDVPVPFTDDDVERARALVAERRSEPWGFKEPRTALFLELWGRALPEACNLFLFRDPMAVLDSLMRRGTNEAVNDRPVTALEMWHLYNAEMVRFTQAHPERSIWCETARFLEDPDVLIDTLRGRFGIDLRTAPLGEVFEDTAYHREVRRRAKLVAARHRPQAKACSDLYEELQRLAGTDG